ncbi:hypothetical protein MPLB_1200101 [Mesorhizobium sp. ORS 3324]|nr:hypothetical protein MPLB_1200101 [Mesorhizobium sp. ORS 3324]
MDRSFPCCTRTYLVPTPAKRLLEAYWVAVPANMYKKLTRLFSYVPLQSGIAPNYGPYSAQANVFARIPCGSRARPTMRCAS